MPGTAHLMPDVFVISQKATKTETGTGTGSGSGTGTAEFRIVVRHTLGPARDKCSVMPEIDVEPSRSKMEVFVSTAIAEK